MHSDGTGQLQQRIRIGLTGLAFVFVLVLLGTAISRSSGDDGPGGGPANLVAVSEPNEPLAEIGAAPGQSPANEIVSDAPAKPR